MKKYFFLALMAGVAMCNVSCSSDDDSKSETTTDMIGNIIKGELEEQAAHYEIAKSEAPKSVTVVEVKKEDGSVVKTNPGLTGFSVTEYGNAVIEVDVDGTKKYCTYDTELDKTLSVEGKEVFLVKDKGSKVVGNVTILNKKAGARVTRASETVEMIFNLSISVEINGQMVPLQFDNTAQAQQTIETVVNTVTTQLTNTWKVEYMKLVISYDDPKKNAYSTDEESGNLRPFIQRAIDNGVTLTEKEQEQLKRTIESIIIDKNNLLVLNYDNAGSDAATWRWVNDTDVNNLAIGITLKDKDMGNKFIKNNSKIGVELRSGGKVNIILTTRLEEDKCTVSLILNLK